MTNKSFVKLDYIHINQQVRNLVINVYAHPEL